MARLERIGETREFGSLLLSLLAVAGWNVCVTRRFAGGVLVIAAKGSYEVRGDGETVGDVAVEVFKEAMRLQGVWRESAAA